MTILQKLRAETSTYHSAIEENPLLKKLTGDLSQIEYISILKKFYGFYLPFENSLDWNEVAVLTENKFSAHRRKIPLLEKDLHFFNVILDQISLSSVYPRSPSFPALLGCFYVLEGSCLGRKMMWSRLSKKLNLTENQGGVFFYDCGDKLKETWKDFCELLTSKIRKDPEEQECIAAAIQTFENMDKWFKD